MVETDTATVALLDMGWNDVGSWSALSGDVIAIDYHNAYAYGDRLVAMRT